jgi:hypothetical protein
VTRVEFLPDDSRLISTGGRDTAIMQWVIAWSVLGILRRPQTSWRPRTSWRPLERRGIDICVDNFFKSKAAFAEHLFRSPREQQDFNGQITRAPFGMKQQITNRTFQTFPILTTFNKRGRAKLGRFAVDFFSQPWNNLA